MTIRFRKEGVESISRYHRGVPVPPEMLQDLPEDFSPWYEDHGEIERALVEGGRRRALLKWVEVQMRFKLNRIERRCIQLHYLRGLSFRQIGSVLRIHHSSAQRHTETGILKLREIARKKGLRRD